MQKFDFGWGSAPDPAGGAYSAPPDPLAGGEGASRPLPKNPTPASAFGLDTSAPRCPPEVPLFPPNTEAARIDTALEMRRQMRVG